VVVVAAAESGNRATISIIKSEHAHIIFIRAERFNPRNTHPLFE